VLYRQPIYQGNLLDKTAVDQLQQGMDKQPGDDTAGHAVGPDPFHHDRWDYVASRRTDRSGPTEVKNMTLWFENGSCRNGKANTSPKRIRNWPRRDQVVRPEPAERQEEGRPLKPVFNGPP
jgi:outer membrane protein assembly factor BamE